MNFQTLDLDYFKQIAERVKAERALERAEALKRKIEPQAKAPEIQEPEAQEPPTFEKGEPRKDYVFVPALGLYLSENRYHQNETWNQTQEIVHKEGKRMPTIPEFVELLKYLRIYEGKKNVKNAEKILDEVYTVREPWRSEWLDAKFEDKNGMYVSYHTFDSKGKIIQKQEKLEAYLAEDKTPGIDLESWLKNPTKQGLPKANCKAGKLYYWSPVNGAVAGFVAFSDGAGLGCVGNRGNLSAGLGVRYVEPLASGETSQSANLESRNNGLRSRAETAPKK